jgi:hypothetical protein
LVKRGNEERRVDLGPLIDDGSGRCGALQLPRLASLLQVNGG